MPNQKDEPLTYTIFEVSKLLRISRATAYSAAKTGSIPTLKFGRCLRVSRRALQALLDGQNQNMKDQDGERAQKRKD